MITGTNVHLPINYEFFAEVFTSQLNYQNVRGKGHIYNDNHATK